MNEAATLPVRHKLDVDVYYRMAELGLFGEDSRVELHRWRDLRHGADRAGA